MGGVLPYFLDRLYPNLLFLAFLDFLAFSLFKDFLAILSVFPSFPKDFRGSLAFLVVFLAVFQKARKRRSGKWAFLRDPREGRQLKP